VKIMIDRVEKTYKNGYQAIKPLTLQLKPGITGLIGPNGAGKSTLMRMLATVSKPSSGRITWDEYDMVKNPDTVRGKIGYLPQDFGVYPNLNTIEFLQYIAAVKGLQMKQAKLVIGELIESLNLYDVRKKPIRSLSGGMKQRVGIAQALLNGPELLIVDEPTVGLDPEERIRFRHLLADLAGERIILLSTHIVSDIEATASQIAVLVNGTLKVHDKPETLMNNLEGRVWQMLLSEEKYKEINRNRTFIVSSTIRKKDGFLTRIVSDVPPGQDASLISPNLEDVYLFYTDRRGDK
jgi:ABC-2 type transport system ATP-binding protein